MTSRDDFIAQLIAALQENESTTADASAASASADQESALLFALGNRAVPDGSKMSQDVLARQAYEALQFDFPEVHDAQVAALASTYRAITEKRVAATDARQFSLTNTMLEGIEFLNDSANKNRGTEASGLLAASLLILIPRFCVVSPDDAVSAALLQGLQAAPPRTSLATPAEQQAKMEQYTHGNAATAAHEQEQFSGGFVEVYAAEEDPDDLSLVYEGSVSSSIHPAVPKPTYHLADSRSVMPHRSGQLAELASKTYSTCFSMIPSDKWIEWRLDEALCTLSKRLLETESADEEDDSQRVFGLQGEWQRYLFVLRDQLLRFSDASDTCAGGLATLKALLIDNPSPEPTAKAQTSDPFFSFTKASKGTAEAPTQETTRRVRIVFRIFAELAVSKEFNSLKARKSQHALAATIQQLFPTILRELQTLSTRVSQPSFEADHSDFVIVLLQLLHFVVDAAGGTAESHQGIVDKLQDSGLLRAWLGFLPPVDASSCDWPWLVPLLRLLGECALWNSEFATFVHRVPKVTKLLETTQEEVRCRLSCECVLLLLAAHQQNVPLTKSSPVTLWTWFTSERIFPCTCLSFVESMEKMSNAVFLLDALAKAMPTLRPPVANELRTSLQSIYNSRFITAFQYPTFTIPTTSTDAIESLNKDEPEPPPLREIEQAEEEKHDDEEERGRAEALQFLALRNRLRQCAKTILLSRMAGFSSSKLD